MRGHLFKDLNENQRKAVTAPNKDVLLILAGPGTGKTKVITCKVAYLLLRHKLPPEDIIVATFTKKAANEMVERLRELLKPYPEIDLKKLVIGTFHSICVRILRSYGKLVGLNPGFKIADETDSKQVIKKVLESKNLGWGIEGSVKEADVKKYKNFISSCKSKAQFPHEVPLDIKEHNFVNRLDVYTRYQELLMTNNLIDFDDCLLYAHKLLSENPRCLSRVKHVLVDEFQDTNMVQLQLVYMMSDSSIDYKDNVTVVGDPDQSIYAFRNAESENFFRMEEHYQKKGVNVSKIMLNENYRSTTNILTLAETLMAKQYGKREDKQLKAHRPDNKLIDLAVHLTNKIEAKNIAQTIKDLVNEKQSKSLDYSDFAILLRSGYLSRIIEQELIHEKLPYQVVHGRSFWELKEIKVMVDYLRAVASDLDWLAFSRTLSFQVSGLGDKSLILIEDMFQKERSRGNKGEISVILQNIVEAKTKGISTKVVEGVRKYLEMIATARKLMTTDDSVEIQQGLDRMFEYILKETKLINAINEKKSKTKEDAEAEIKSNLKELKNQLLEFNINEETLLLDAYEEIDSSDEDLEESTTEPNQSIDFLSQFLDSIYLYGETRDSLDSKSKVTITTVHGSKGLEWPVVFIPSLCDGIFPSQYALKEEDEEKRKAALDEERRCMYVAVTRAKQSLYLSSFKETVGFGFGDSAKQTSRFLKNLPPNLINKRKAPSWNNGSGQVVFPALKSSFGASSWSTASRKLSTASPYYNPQPPGINVASPTSSFQSVKRPKVSVSPPISQLPHANPTTPLVKLGNSQLKRKRLGMGRPLRPFGLKKK